MWIVSSGTVGVDGKGKENMKRKFLPVGQGAFFCERFSADECGIPINVVYDCGTVSGLSHLKKIVDQEFKKSDVIDALFISHLHEDHINGIPMLMARCRVKRVYLPLISPIDLALMRLDYETRNRPSMSLDKLLLGDEMMLAEYFVRRMLEDPQNALVEVSRRYNRDTEVSQLNSFVVGVTPQTRQTQGLDDLSEPIFPSVEKGIRASKWRYKTFCIKNDVAVESVMWKFRETFTGDPTPERIAELVKEGCADKKIRKKIRGLYVDIKGGFNSHSLTMCSENIDSGCRQVIDKGLCNGNMFSYVMPGDVASGCLYTGDFNASNIKYWLQMKSAYKDNWKRIGCVQVPHHGSQYSFNDGILNKETYHVISAGLGNHHHHPSGRVLGKYQRSNIFPFVVTQDPRSMFCTDVNLK